MNILTIPLAAVGVFVLALTYQQFHKLENSESMSPSPKMEIKTHDGHAHERRSPGKPGAAIKLLSDGTQTLDLMQSKKMEILLQSALTDGTLEVSIKPDDSLVMVTTQREWSFDLSKGQQMILPVEVMATKDGIYHLNIFVSHADLDGGNVARALAVEFSVGSQGVTMQQKHEATSSEAYPTVVRLSGNEEIY